VPHQPWLAGADASTLTRLGSYRSDDPDGEVGIETHLLGPADGRVLQVPLTYRGAPRPTTRRSLGCVSLGCTSSATTGKR
jgi:hypothetical protein